MFRIVCSIKMHNYAISFPDVMSEHLICSSFPRWNNKSYVLYKTLLFDIESNKQPLLQNTFQPNQEN